MKSRITLIVLFIGLFAMAQTPAPADTGTYLGKKGLYRIDFNKKVWQKSSEESLWDAEFHDLYNLVNVYYMEFDNFFPEKSLKATIKEQYESQGKVSDIKLYKKQINGMEVDYFECKLDYQGFVWVYQGFFYNGLGGAVELQFMVQEEGLAQYQKLIDDFCKGFVMVEK